MSSTDMNRKNPVHNVNARKRLRQLNSAAISAPLPPTATRTMLEALLDAKPAKKKKKLAATTPKGDAAITSTANGSDMEPTNNNGTDNCSSSNNNSMWSHVVQKPKQNSYRVPPSRHNNNNNNIHNRPLLSSKPSLLSDAPNFKHKKISTMASKSYIKSNSKHMGSKTKGMSQKQSLVSQSKPTTNTTAQDPTIITNTNEENKTPTTSMMSHTPSSTQVSTPSTTAPSSMGLDLGSNTCVVRRAHRTVGIAQPLAPSPLPLVQPQSISLNVSYIKGGKIDSKDSTGGNIQVSSQGGSTKGVVAPSASSSSSSRLPIGLKLRGGNRVADSRKNHVSRSRLPPQPPTKETPGDPSSQQADTGFQNATAYPTTILPPPSQFQQKAPELLTQRNTTSSIIDTSTTTTNNKINQIRLSSITKNNNNPSNNNMMGRLSSSWSLSINQDKGISKRPFTNDNFVRQNLRNSAGACRGARKKPRIRKKNPWKGDYSNHQAGEGEGDDEDESTMNNNNSSNRKEGGWRPKKSSSYAKKSTGGGRDNSTLPTSSRLTGLDPLDDYLDGIFQTPASSGRATTAATTGGGKQESSSPPDGQVPKCPRHNMLCKLLKVKKASTGNKGRKFYVCSMPRGEQCDFFQWDDDTVQAARIALQKNTSQSGFIARQVAAHFDRFKLLTVPELRDEASRRNLNKSGKRQQLLTRLSIWVRDQLVTDAPPEAGQEEVNPEDISNDDENATNDPPTMSVDDPENSSKSSDEEEDDDSDSGEDSELDSTTSEELEICLDDDNDDDDGKTEDSSGLLYKGHGGKSTDGSSATIKALRSRRSQESESRGDKLQSTLCALFGHNNFREGQEWAINRCLDQKRTLLVAPTGFGKSLCYALPAALMDGVCVVVSPLISLIQDQLRSLPPSVPAATLSGSLSAAATAAIVDDVIRNRIKILFVSPERFASASFRRLFRPKWNPETRTKERPFPEISLLCIDEAHCASHWAHNFRPCFLRFKHLLGLANPKSVLAITATAGPRVIADISNTLSIQHIQTGEDGSTNEESLEKMDGIRVLKTNRDNIDVSCLKLNNHEERLVLLAKILMPRSTKSQHNEKDERIASYAGSLSKGAVIVYVWRQRDTEIVAENLNASGVSGGVVVYHGGMDAGSRSKAQSKFMRGKARICVATVAFGLGIDKADVEGIVHMYLSSSPEHYLQEIGRAGRDGRQAKAIALPLLEEVPVRHSLVHSDAICQSQVKRLLLTLRRLVKKAINTGASEDQTPQGSIHVAIPLEPTVIGCDCKPETIETILSLIEQNDESFLHVEGVIYDQATIVLKKRTLDKLAEKEQVAACIKECGSCLNPPDGEEAAKEALDTAKARPGNFQRQFLAYSFGSYGFSVAHCSNKLGPQAEPRHVFASLRRLQTSNEIEFALDTSPTGRALHVQILGKGIDMFCNTNSDNRIDELAESLVQRFSSAVSSSAGKVLDMHYIMHEVANVSNTNPSKISELGSKSRALERFQELVRSYFEGQGLVEERSAEKLLLPDSFSNLPEKRHLVDVMLAIGNDLPLLGKHKTNCVDVESLKLTDPEVSDYVALSIAKFLHGLETPRASCKTFRSHPLFGKWRQLNFKLLLGSVTDVVENTSLH